jgi:hypothetical protein
VFSAEHFDECLKLHVSVPESIGKIYQKHFSGEELNSSIEWKLYSNIKAKLIIEVIIKQK